ncbi:hypothetical protein [Homoserinimonas hongtaonis]|uniref:hypothetical protein n=1 Tax=Homoserinimonas hongtaonis TaxID=2079791 RepID=UPI0011B25BC1|nr:hypothetical protein [Salinibacterium hongtaonis]
MRPPERTRQELDPVGAYSNRLITMTAAISALVFAVVVVVAGLDAVDNPGAAVLSLVVIAASSMIVITATDPYRGPFQRKSHGWTVALGVFAAGLLAVAAGDAPAHASMGWVAPVVLGLFSIGMAAYRPVRELVGFGGVAAVLIGFIVMLQAVKDVSDVPPVVTVAFVVLPLLALNLSAGAFTDSMIKSIEHWHVRATQAVDRMSEEREPGIARSVQQDRVTILKQEVVPFFGEVLANNEITPDVRERARSIADAIRAVMVAEVDRTWLENVVDHLRGRARRGGEGQSQPSTILDDDNIANLMSYDQRTALRALLVAIYDNAHGRPEDLEIMLARADGRCRGVLTLRVDMTDGLVKSRFGPYLAVMRVVFRRVRAEYLQSVLTVRFSYDQ